MAWKALSVEGAMRGRLFWPMMASMEKELFHAFRGSAIPAAAPERRTAELFVVVS